MTQYIMALPCHAALAMMRGMHASVCSCLLHILLFLSASVRVCTRDWLLAARLS